jgi:hypothetical protein
MTTPLISYPLDGTYQGRGILDTLTASRAGAVRFEQGRSYIEEGTVNACINPIPSATTGWTASGVSTIGAVAGWISITRTNNTGIGLITTPSTAACPAASAGQVWTISARLRRNVNTANIIQIRVRWYAGASGTGTLLRTDTSPALTIPLDSVGSVQTLLCAAAPATTVSFDVTFVATTGTLTSGDSYSATEIQFEQKDHATPSTPALDGGGVLQPGNAWNGTAFASASTRTAGELVLPCDRQPAAVALRYSEDGVTYRTLYTESLGQVIGTYGSLAWSNGALRITTTRLLWVDRVFAYDTVLNPREQNHLRSSIEIGRAHWDTLEPNRTVYLTPMWWLY